MVCELIRVGWIGISEHGWIRSRAAWRALLLSTAALCVWLAWAWGPGQEGFFDSAFYLDGARHLADGEGYVSASTEPESPSYAPVIRWAPGFPAVTALLTRVLHVPALDAASLALGLAYVGLVLGSLWLARLLFGPSARLLTVSCALLVACNRDVLATLDALLSDLPFGALAIMSTSLAARLVRSVRWPWYAVLGFAALLAALFAVRYAGALYIPGLLAALALAMWLRRHPLTSILWNLGRVVVLLSGLIGLWIARNLRHGELPFGARVAIHDDWQPHAERAARGFFAWWFTFETSAPWLIGISIGMGLVCAVLLMQRSARLWEGLSFTLLPAFTYAVLMVASASRVKFDPIQHPRFWVPVWPLTLIAVACTVAHATSTLRRRLSSVVVIALMFYGWHELTWLRGALAQADQPRGLLSPAWQAAAAALPDPSECRLFTSDVRPLMLHRRLGPSSEIPQTLRAFDRAASQHARVCLAVLSNKLRVSSTAERRRIEQNKVVAELQQAGRLERVSSVAGVTLYRLR